MKLEIKKDMYIRTKDGIIDKVIIDYNGHCASPNCECKHISCSKDYYDEDKVVKASYNIIDILEEGDYVNGYKISFIGEDCVQRKFVQCDYPVNNGSTNHYRFYEKSIYFIVTKEQMEQIAYKVEE